VLRIEEAPAPLTVRLDGALRSQLDEAASREGVSPESWLQSAIASVLSSSRAAAA
jgi:predicted transcriptional regulator